jgi:hypothetical protein
MAFSHRDHRARRELRQLYLAFGSCVGALALVAIAFPNGLVRLVAVAGLGMTGIVYLVLVERLTGTYRRDLTAVRTGQPVSGSVRAEVYHEVGFERDRDDDWIPSPHHRPPHADPEAWPPKPPGGAPTPTGPARWDRPSDEF